MTNHPGGSLKLLELYDCHEHAVMMGLCCPHYSPCLDDFSASLQQKIDEIKLLQWAEHSNSELQIV